MTLFPYRQISWISTKKFRCELSVCIIILCNFFSYFKKIIIFTKSSGFKTENSVFLIETWEAFCAMKPCSLEIASNWEYKPVVFLWVFLCFLTWERIPQTYFQYKKYYIFIFNILSYIRVKFWFIETFTTL